MRKLSLLFLLLVCCGREKPTELVLLCGLPKELHEISGMQITNGQSFYAIADSGNKSAVHEIGLDGKKKKKWELDIENTDWEDICSDSQGNLYIGDFGNNKNTRTDLAIYKIPAASLKNNPVGTTEKISFDYPEQTDFPPKKSALFYDCEAFFEFAGNFYLFTKNRSKGFDGTAFLYKIPNKAGHHKAALQGKFNSCGNYRDCAITGAAISPDQSRIVLLGHSKIWLIEKFKNDRFLQGTVTQLDLGHSSQKEAVTFKGNDTLLIADEKVKQTGGNVYAVALKSLKSKAQAKSGP